MISFVETNPTLLYNRLVEDFQKALGEPLLQGDERRIFLESFIPIILGMKNDVNFTGNQNLLKYAQGEYLDAIGDMFNVYRFPARQAQARVRFSIGTALDFDIVIPKGTRVTADGKLMFATLKDVLLPTGETEAVIDTSAQLSGVILNGVTAGRINALVDLVPYIVSVSNVEASFGGTDIEDDENYRDRIRISPERFSTAGPIGAYEFYARSASPLVSDVYITSPVPGNVDVYIVSSATVVPDDILLETVQTALTMDLIRPLTDHVNVKSAVVKEYDINVVFYNTLDSGIKDTELQAVVESKISDFINDNKNKMGGALNPDKLKLEILKGGAYRADIIEPEYTPLLANEVAVIGNIAVTKG